VVRVEFYRGSIKLGEDGSAPFAFSWTDAAAGSYTLTAVAVDDAGATTTSRPINVSVLGTDGAGTVLLQDGLDGYEGSKDAYLFEYHRENNYGSRAQLLESNSGWRNRTLFQFAIFQSEGGPVPDGATITSARLSLYKSSYYDHEYQLKPLLVGWEEDTVTWDERKAGVSWNVPGGSAQSGDVAATADAQASVGWNPGWIEFDVTTGLQEVSSGRDNHGWMLEPLGGNSNTKRLLSSESSSQALRPKLEVTYSVD
jgi:hypothetical protein